MASIVCSSTFYPAFLFSRLLIVSSGSSNFELQKSLRLKSAVSAEHYDPIPKLLSSAYRAGSAVFLIVQDYIFVQSHFIFAFLNKMIPFCNLQIYGSALIVFLLQIKIFIFIKRQDGNFYEVSFRRFFG